MKVLTIAFSAPLLLIGAAYPDMPKAGDGGIHPAPGATTGPATYRPCRPGPGDDRCIQLYERGVRAAYAGWQRRHGAEEAPTRLAMGGPPENRGRHSRRATEAPRATASAAAPTAPSTGHEAGGTRCVEPERQRGETSGM